ncbi:MAG: YezD family protein [Lachnospiraceae bacterium]|nr:YezD family protein [Lachnospiraceae bacterium]
MNNTKKEAGKEVLQKTYISQDQLAVIQKKASEIQYGTVTLVIQDSRIVQIDCTEKIRIV